jgi:hypothetical protein
VKIVVEEIRALAIHTEGLYSPHFSTSYIQQSCRSTSKSLLSSSLHLLAWLPIFSKLLPSQVFLLKPRARGNTIYPPSYFLLSISVLPRCWAFIVGAVRPAGPHRWAHYSPVNKDPQHGAPRTRHGQPLLVLLAYIVRLRLEQYCVEKRGSAGNGL